MNYYPWCELCGKAVSDHKHHLYSRTLKARELYGKLIDDERNIMYLCGGCHLNKSIPKFTEVEFCEAIGIEPRSKTAQIKKLKNWDFGRV
jgi:5-methylcytosine-specific restriction endonuclease McrA